MATAPSAHSTDPPVPHCLRVHATQMAAMRAAAPSRPGISNAAASAGLPTHPVAAAPQAGATASPTVVVWDTAPTGAIVASKQGKIEISGQWARYAIQVGCTRAANGGTRHPACQPEPQS